ncbi:MAG: hypothetical protein EAZ67_04445 [Cytophagales bacterium]|nr:MAG: hypothetical protein EAZ67_04445 [Cytophagales bacterium]
MTTPFKLLPFQEQLQNGNISMAFRGGMSQEILSLMGWSLRRAETNTVVSRRLFGMIIELSQNILHYSAEREYSEYDQKEIGCGIITISKEDKQYIINAGNYITHDKVSRITSRCEHINSLTPEELKAYYKAQRRLPHADGGTGANIGFIDMVRKSGNKIAFNFYDSPERPDCCFFVLTVTVNTELSLLD